MVKKIFLFFILIRGLSAQVQLWYQLPSGNIGPAINVNVTSQKTIFASVYNKGIYRSMDNGTSWLQVAPHTDGVWSLAIQPNGEMIASLWSKGIYRTTNNGDTWTQISSNKLYADVRAVNSQNEIFIEAEGKLFRSSDNGSEWLPATIGAGVIVTFGDTMFASKGKSVYRSNNNGKQWTFHSELPSSVYALSITGEGKLVAGTFFDNSVNASSIFSFNGTTQVWTGNGPASTINAFIRRSDGILFAASHDSGFYFSTNSGGQWKQQNVGLSTKKIYSLALLNDTTIVLGTVDGIFFSSGPLNSLLPVELMSFTASVRNTAVDLRWKTATETNSFGFEIERRMTSQKRPDLSSNDHWTTLAFIEGGGTSNIPREYQFSDPVVLSGVYEYRLKQIDRDGKFHFSQPLEVSVFLVPQKYSLEQNYPNPFNPSTTIDYVLPVRERVVITIFDLLGREVNVLINATMDAGPHSISFHNASISSGTYLYTLRAGNFVSTKKMMLQR